MASNPFIEEYPLHRKLKIEPSNEKAFQLYAILNWSINMYCDTCKADRTFVQKSSVITWQSNRWLYKDEGLRREATREIHFLSYSCASCQDFDRSFTLLVDHENDEVHKTGQYPAWSISVNKDTSDVLGADRKLFKNGLICESQGYGIGAYSYYRRIVEIKIDSLLDEIANFLSGSARTEYEAALTQIRSETVAAKKIELAKELLPDALRPDGLNPLEALYVALSEGIHRLSDEECLELASAIRTSLVYLIKKTAENKRESTDFVSSVQKILGRRKKSGKE